VWQLAHARAFDVLEGSSRLLITTRDRSILTAVGARDLRLEGVAATFALDLLAAWAAVPRTSLPIEASQIAKEVAYLPLALSLAGAQIQEGGSWKLRQAGRDNDLEGILTSPDWMFARLTRFSVQALLADYREARLDSLRLVRDALVLSAHVLTRNATAFSDQLASRLRDKSELYPQFQRPPVPSLLQGRSRLRPLTACLTAPGGPLLQTWEGHDWDVNAISVLPDGQRAISASFDNSLRVWDIGTGAVLQILEAHTDSVNAVAVLPDGRRAVSASDDQTLKVWDIETGSVLRTLEGHTKAVNAVAVLPEAKSGRWGAGLTAAKMKDCRWLKPVLVGQFEFLEWTGDNHLRHSKFIALREDKNPREVRRE
jgi:WD40 domain-containing protein/ATP dependent DNA ligase-like protein